MPSILPILLFDFIKKDTSVREFYNYITQNSSNFSFDINEREPRTKRTMLHRACALGNLALAQALINMGANINAVTDEYKTPLTDAISNGHLDVVKMLIRNGADIESKNAQIVNNYIKQASGEVQLAIKEYLLDRPLIGLAAGIINKLNYDHDFKDKANNKNLGKNVLSKDLIDSINSEGRNEIYQKTVREIVRKKEDIKQAVINNDLHQLKLLLEGDKDLIKVDLSSTYFMSGCLTRFAMRHNNLEMVKLLIKHGDLSLEHTLEKTIAEEARERGFTSIADFLDNHVASAYQSLLNDAKIQERQKNKISLHLFFEDEKPQSSSSDEGQTHSYLKPPLT
ncbi:Ribulose-5-phosphate 4-epimerase and related epimerases and aldolases [Legionella beliardensis]|uniref:Ribulose-5-phosphate 4-epimerase and related epimerases and aldolases n=1 Tax=Legionella beliardensis TaxID=91822 RepID=A0A378JRJ0_9GAMM|nr:ankyrin repeat domain-containing protein [Legionella beliardensis]STX55778.1 Ribulose-5-phosphate 4-epimerase and related epimerases and aldolases [Legionella beliardensis]